MGLIKKKTLAQRFLVIFLMKSKSSKINYSLQVFSMNFMLHSVYPYLYFKIKKF